MPDTPSSPSAPSPPDDEGTAPLSPFGQMVGEEIVSATPDEVLIRVPIEPHLHQPYGIVHGGVWCTIVETAASTGAAVWLMTEGPGGNVVGVSNHTDFIRAVRDGVVTARATPIHRGRTQQLWLVEITDDTGRLAARGQVRLQNIPDAGRIGHR